MTSNQRPERLRRLLALVPLYAACLACGAAASSAPDAAERDALEDGSGFAGETRGSSAPPAPAVPALRPVGSAPMEPGVGGIAPATESCTSILVMGLSVTIDNPSVSCPELSVFATDTKYTEQLPCHGQAQCTCSGAAERTGKYVVSVWMGDPPVELARSEQVTVGAQGCHVTTEFVLFEFPTQLGAGGPPQSLDAGTADRDAGSTPP